MSESAVGEEFCQLIPDLLMFPLGSLYPFLSLSRTGSFPMARVVVGYFLFLGGRWFGFFLFCS